MSGLFSFIVLNAGYVPGTDSETIIAFISGSSANETIWEIVVSCSCMKLSGTVTTVTFPPSLDKPYFFATASAPRKLSSDWETDVVTIPIW